MTEALARIKELCETTLNENRDWDDNPFADAIMEVHHVAEQCLEPVEVA
ncbi:MAG: hypothetical protein WDZ59_10775 [Pirellulales bacterium]